MQDAETGAGKDVSAVAEGANEIELPIVEVIRLHLNVRPKPDSNTFISIFPRNINSTQEGLSGQFLLVLPMVLVQ